VPATEPPRERYHVVAANGSLKRVLVANVSSVRLCRYASRSSSSPGSSGSRGLPLLLGFSPTFWMMAAGWVECCAAFAILVFRIGAQAAALPLLTVALAAVPLFGPVDAVGHAPFLVALLILAATPRNRIAPAGQWAPRLAQHGTRVAALTLVAVISLFMLYVGMHGLRNTDGIEQARTTAINRS
jgi:hypothetical protein